MHAGLPGDPVILLGVINTKLRDFYSSLDALCEDMEIDRDELNAALDCADRETFPDRLYI